MANPAIVEPAPIVENRIEQLELVDFRNYLRLQLAAPPGLAVLYGANGAGKTNLLEALSLLTPGRGLRGAKLNELDRRGGGPWVVRARVAQHGETRQLAVGRDPGQERKLVKIDGDISRSQQELGDILSVLWLTPALDRLFLDSASDRRKFLDRLVVVMVPDHARQLGRYERSLRERALLLKQGRHDQAWLSALERRMAEAGVAIAAGRLEIIRLLNPMLVRHPFMRARAVLALAGDLETWLDEQPALAVEQRFAEALQASRTTDAQTGGAAIGPHRSDLLVHDTASDEPAAQVSTGRQKILLISIILAEIRVRREQRGEAPLLLLDEIPAHLDQRHRAELFEVLLELNQQCWLTGTEAALFDHLTGHAAFFHVKDAKLETDE